MDSSDYVVFLLNKGNREQIIKWLSWNDKNGVYTDEDSIAEGYEPLTLDSALSTLQNVLTKDE